VKKNYINKVSKKQAIELKKRAELKAQLISEYGAVCATCGARGDWRGLSLHHKKFLSRLGETQFDNVELLCYPCHSKLHGIREVTESGK